MDALLSDASTDVTSSIKIDDSNHKAVGNISNIKLSQIEVNPFNPRVEFEKEGLAELAASIKELGLVQPLTVKTR